MSSSYLGITAHFHSNKDHRRHSVTLAMHPMPQMHTVIKSLKSSKVFLKSGRFLPPRYQAPSQTMAVILI